MSLKVNYNYLLVAFLVIFLGIISRKISFIPLFIGDILYAIMIYCMIKFFIWSKNNTLKLILPLSICFIIELSQIIDLNWLNALRHTALGYYILGQGFLYSDLLCYTIGILIAFTVDANIKD